MCKYETYSFNLPVSLVYHFIILLYSKIWNHRFGIKNVIPYW